MLKDPFHLLKPYTDAGLRKSHPLYPVAIALLRDALFYNNPVTLKEARDAVVARGMPPEEASRLPDSWFIGKGMVQRQILEVCALLFTLSCPDDPFELHI